MSNIQQPKIIMQAKLQAKTTHATSPSIALLTVPWFSLVFAFLFFSAAFFSFSAWPARIIYLSSSASFCSSWAISASISAKVVPAFSARYSRLIPALRARLVFFSTSSECSVSAFFTIAFNLASCFSLLNNLLVTKNLCFAEVEKQHTLVFIKPLSLQQAF